MQIFLAFGISSVLYMAEALNLSSIFSRSGTAGAYQQKL
jgi:hypothetical protein